MKIQCSSMYGQLGTPKSKFCVIMIPASGTSPLPKHTALHGEPSEVDVSYRFFVGTIAESGDLEPYQECRSRDEAWLLAADWNRKEEQSS